MPRENKSKYGRIFYDTDPHAKTERKFIFIRHVKIYVAEIESWQCQDIYKGSELIKADIVIHQRKTKQHISFGTIALRDKWADRLRERLEFKKELELEEKEKNE